MRNTSHISILFVDLPLVEQEGRCHCAGIKPGGGIFKHHGESELGTASGKHFFQFELGDQSDAAVIKAYVADLWWRVKLRSDT